MFAVNHLRALRLDSYRVALAPGAITRLTNVRGVSVLSLDNGPLALTPSIDRVPGLSVLVLGSALVARLPRNLLRLRTLSRTGLDGGRVHSLPDSLLRLPQSTKATVGLHSGPFSRRDLRLLRTCFGGAEVSFNIRTVVSDTRVRISSSRSSAVRS